MSNPLFGRSVDVMHCCLAQTIAAVSKGLGTRHSDFCDPALRSKPSASKYALDLEFLTVRDGYTLTHDFAGPYAYILPRDLGRGDAYGLQPTGTVYRCLGVPGS